MPGYMHRACHNVRQFVRASQAAEKSPAHNLYRQLDAAIFFFFIAVSSVPFPQRYFFVAI
ncbi:MAG: hypothetical protein AUI12_04795 [Acidobacteria bacterium 13_2_20CM_2_57_6]|nr:MAG: hypothetical protein AUI12_04795 [Acidobacteria bacterium 13_2_20CM_2_57_6]